MNFHVFICYSRKDEGFVLKLATNLKNRGVPVWLDQWDIPTGANWDRTIETALNDSNRLLLILSPSSANSDEVQCEWREALDDKKVVVPILYQPCEIPYRLNTIQYIDFTSRSPDDEKSLKLILNALGMAGSTLIKPPVQSEPEQDNISYWLDKGNALNDMNKYAEAIKAYDEAIKLDPKNADAWNGKGKAIRLDPHYTDLSAVCARSFWKGKGDGSYFGRCYADALKAYNEAIKLDPNNADFWNSKGNALKKLGLTIEANEAYAKAKELGYKS
ncbi:MAG: TIR domain-containing protein [Methanothrix sp.]|jgi:tetratricopeptide (TPR) repeat protein